MLQQVLGLQGQRQPLARQVSRCRHHDGFALHQGAGDDIGVKVLHHEGHIKLVHPARSIGIDVDVQHQPGVQCVPLAEQRRQKVGGQHRRRHYADGAAQIPRAGSRCRFGVFNLVQDAAYPRQIGVARLGQGQLARGALQQPRAQMLLEIRH
ncbi:hypothetical protein D3C71_1355110 [compost metagenome]